ncbi:hypothetical protein BC629DRAFT_163225 [Irpex lacteus]|nr:hypothetical protein BC629DRAFT_163225 [Irpex lacteus]
MSSIAEFQQELVATYLSTSACVWFLQETVFALRQEVDAIWNRKWTVMTWIYAFTRYSTAVDSILHLVPYGSSVQGCKANQYADDALSLIPFLCFALFSALRVHALLDGEYFIAGLVFVFNVVPFVTNMYNFTTSILVDNSEICTTFPSGSDNLRLAYDLQARYPDIALKADLLRRCECIPIR